MNSTITNTLLILLLLLLVGFGVWYISSERDVSQEDNASLELNIGGTSGEDEGE